MELNPLERHAEAVAKNIVEANSNDLSEKIKPMEERINEKNHAYFQSLQTEMRTLISDIGKPKTTYMHR